MLKIMVQKNRIIAMLMIFALVCSMVGISKPEVTLAQGAPTQTKKLEGGTTETLTSGYLYYITENVTYTATADGGNGLKIADGQTVYIYIPEGCTLKVTGKDGKAATSTSGGQGGGAGIYLPESSTLVLLGKGSVNATGGAGGNAKAGTQGAQATHNHTSESSCSFSIGAGGKGGAGGGGGGAGIGTNGATGGYHSDYGKGGSAKSVNRDKGTSGNEGGSGYKGADASTMGILVKAGDISITASGGKGGTKGSGGSQGSVRNSLNDKGDDRGVAGGAGGGGGGAGYDGAQIGTGGGSGGQGGGGGSAGYIWGAYYVGGGGGGGGAGQTVGDGGIRGQDTEFSTADGRSRGRTRQSSDGNYSSYGSTKTATVGGIGASAYIYNSNGDTQTSGTGGKGGTGGAAGKKATESAAVILSDSNDSNENISIYAPKYSVTFEGSNTSPESYYFAMGSEIEVPEYEYKETDAGNGKSFWGWKVKEGVSNIVLGVIQLASAYDFSIIRSTSSLLKDNTVYSPRDKITMSETAYGDVTLEPLFHEWQCEPDEKNTDILNIYCTSASDEDYGCKFHKNSGSPIVLKLSAEDAQYTGQAYNKAEIVNLEEIKEEITDGITIEFQYRKVTEDATSETAPTDPGSYIVTAVVTCGENEYQLEKPFVISHQLSSGEWSEWSGQLLYHTPDDEVQSANLENDVWAMRSVSKNAEGKITQANLKNITKPTKLKVNLMDNASMEGVEVQVYQLLSISKDNGDGNYSYTLADNAYSGFFQQYFGVAENDVIDDSKIMELLGTLDTNEAKKQFSNSLKDYMDTHSIKPLVSSVGGYGQKEMDFDISRQYSYENGKGRYFAGLGYYFITRSDAIDDTYTLRVINEAETTLTLKGSTLRIHKSGDQVLMKKGDSVLYTLESKIVNTGGNAEYWYCIYDWLEETMQADMDSFELYVENGNSKIPLAKNRDYVLSQTTITPEGTTPQNVIKIQLLFDKKSVLYADNHMGDTLVVRYKAQMKKTATSGIALGYENFNKAWLEYGEDKKVTETQEWNVYTLGLRIHKTDESKTPLKGAEFKLYATNDVLRTNPLRFSKDSTGYYYLDNEKGSSSLETDEFGNIEIHGLDETNFILSETKPPAGYQKIDDQIVQIMIQENEDTDRFLSLDVETNKNRLVEVASDINDGYITLNIKNPAQGSNDLPATGGMGRSIVYITASAMLAIGVGGLILKRKREKI